MTRITTDRILTPATFYEPEPHESFRYFVDGSSYAVYAIQKGDGIYWHMAGEYVAPVGLLSVELLNNAAAFIESTIPF